MKDNIVSVLLWGKEICKLQWRGGYIDRFGKAGALVSFNPEYHTFGFDVDPLGPYRSSVYLVQKGLSDICRATEDEGLPRFLTGSLPDAWGNQVFSTWISANKIRHSDITSVDKLAFIGKRGMGAFEFIPELYSPASDNALVLEELYSLSREIEASRENTALNLNDKPAIKDLMKVGMSAGGMHPKAIIAINPATGEVRSGQMPLPEGFIHYILKFRDSDSWPAGDIEYIYYRMASECGIEMENSSILQIDGVNNFLTERFDRKNGNKIHSATLRALCGETTSYEDIFKVCRGLHLPYHDLEQVYRRAVFNYSACVCDDHDRNFSFMMTENGNWRLSPAYDETFTKNVNNLFIGDRHAMTIDHCDRRVTRAQMLRLAAQNDIRNANNIIDEVSDTVMTFEAKANQVGIEKDVIDIIKGGLQLTKL